VIVLWKDNQSNGVYIVGETAVAKCCILCVEDVDANEIFSGQKELGGKFANVSGRRRVSVSRVVVRSDLMGAVAREPEPVGIV